MSFKEEKREKIKRYILDKVDMNQKDLARRTANTFEISLNTVYRYVRELEEQRIIEKKDGRYVFVEKVETVRLRLSKRERLEEDDVYIKYIDKFVNGLPDNVQRIWQYSFTEMMNNAIEHSEAALVTIMVVQNYLNTAIFIVDNGIGIFRKIKEYYSYASLDDAVNELFKGKLTTDKKNHSGEGIFFTSRILDRFAAVSDGKIFSHDKYTELLRNLEDKIGRAHV